MKNFLKTGTSIVLTLGSDPFGRKSLEKNINQNYELINLKYLPSLCQVESLNPDLIILNLYNQKKENLEHLLKLSQEIKDQYGSNLPIMCLCADNLKKQVSNYHFERVWPIKASTEHIISEIEDLIKISQQNKQLWDTLNKLEHFKKTVNKELEQASIFQGALFNQAIARTNLQVSYHYFFQREIGGDFFRIFDLSASHIGILIGDVRGRGAGGAVLMGFILGELYAISSEKQRILWAPSQLLGHLSESIYSHNQMSELCSTAWYGVLDLITGQLEYARAGHSFPLVAHSEKKEISFIEGGSGFPLGIFPGMTYRNHHLQIPPQSRLLLYTEGLLNQKDIHEKPLYTNWLKDCFTQNCIQNKNLKDLPALIDSSFTDLCAGAEATDDRIILCCEIPTCNSAYIDVGPKQENNPDSLLAKIETNDLELIWEQIMACLPQNLDFDTRTEFEIGLEELLNKANAQVQKGRLIATAQEQEPKAKGFIISWWIHSDRLDLSVRLDAGSVPWCYIPDLKSKQEDKIETAALILYFDNLQASNDGLEISMSKIFG